MTHAHKTSEISVVIGGPAIDTNLLQRAQTVMKHYLEPEQACNLVWIAPGVLIEGYRDLLDREILAFSPDVIQQNDIVLWIESDDESVIPIGFHMTADQIGFRFSSKGRLYPLNEAAEDWIRPWTPHVFSKCAEGFDRFYYFPYGYLYRDLSVGRCNPFGFRIQESDTERLSKRDREKTKLICTFGGSAAFSMNCLPNEMFSFQLENILNQRAENQSLSWRYRVLNFGMHGHVVLNEIQTFMLFAEQMRPDIVIAHDGFNDLAYGCNADAFLMQNHQIVFQENLELWALILADQQHRMDEHQKEFFKVTNLPKPIVRSYLARKAQFRRWVEALGCQWIGSFQPFLSQKPELTDWEQKFCVSWAQSNPMRSYFSRMDFLFETYLRLRIEFGFADDIDFREAILKKTDQSLFADFVHMRPEGDQMIASIYADKLLPEG